MTNCLIVGGGIDSLPLVEAARDYGMRPIVLAKDLHPDVRADDMVWLDSYYDQWENVLSLQDQWRPSAVLCRSSRLAPWYTAKIAECFGIAHTSPSVVLAYINRNRLLEGTAQRPLSSDEPCWVKRAFGSGSGEDVFWCPTIDDKFKAIRHLWDMHREDPVIQRHYGGNYPLEVKVTAVAWQGEIMSAAMKDWNDDCYDLLKDVVDKFNWSGPIGADMILTDDGPVIIDRAAEIAGSDLLDDNTAYVYSQLLLEFQEGGTK